MTMPSTPERVSAPLRTVAGATLRGIAGSLNAAADVVARTHFWLSDRFPRTIEDDANLDYISVEEGRQILDEAARRHFNMSGDEFLKHWDAGDFEDSEDPNLMRVAMLVPLGR